MSRDYLDKTGLTYFWGKIKNFLKYRNIVPEQSKTFTGILGTADTWAGRTYFFGSIKPTSWYDTWKIKYKIATSIPGKNTYAQIAEVSISGNQGDMRYYSSLNAISSYYPCSYHELYRLKSAGLTNGYGHALGFQVASGSSYYPTTAGYERTIVVDIYETVNCTFDFYDSCLHYANIPGTGSTNYNTYSELNFTSNGLQETGDANDVNYQNRIYYLYRKPYTVLYRYQILLSRLDGTLLPINTVSNSTATNKALTTESFDPFGEIYYYNSTSIVQTTGYIGNASLYRQILADLRYSFNTGTTLIANKPVFLVVVPQSDGSAKLHSSPILQDYPTTEDGLLYILLGYPYAETNPYRVELYLTHPIYWYKNGRVRLYNPDASTVNGHTVNSDVPSDAVFTDSGGTVTQVTAGTGLSVGSTAGGNFTTSGTLNHTNSVTAQGTQALYPIKIDAQGHISAYGTAITNATAASGGSTVSLVTTGDKYTWNNKPGSNAALGQGYGTCSNSGTTQSCTVTLSNYALSVGGIVCVKFTSSGVAAGSTLNINGKGAKPIKYLGSNITGDLIATGDIATFIYDGTNYHLLAVDRVTNAAAVPMDYVVGTATNLNGGSNGYTMWNSGKLEVWIRQTVSGVNITSGPYGGLYYTYLSAISYQLTPSSPTFIEYPVLNITVQGPAGIGIAVPNYDNYSVSDTGAIYLYNPVSVTNKSVTVNIYAVGKWK